MYKIHILFILSLIITKTQTMSFYWMSSSDIALYIQMNLTLLEVDNQTNIHTYMNKDNTSLFKYQASGNKFYEKKLNDPPYLSYRSTRISKCCEQCCYDYWTNTEPSQFHNWSFCFESRGCINVCCIHNQLTPFTCPASALAQHTTFEKAACPNDKEYFSNCKYNNQVCSTCSPCTGTTVEKNRSLYPSCFDTMNTLCINNCTMENCPINTYETSRTAYNCLFCSACSTTCPQSNMYKCKSCTSTENIKCCLCTECPLNTYEVIPCTFSSNTACIQCPGNK